MMFPSKFFAISPLLGNTAEYLHNERFDNDSKSRKYLTRIHVTDAVGVRLYLREM
jgi:hypothetical protein